MKGEPIVSLLTQDLVSVTFEQLKKDAANLRAQVSEKWKHKWKMETIQWNPEIAHPLVKRLTTKNQFMSFFN